MMKLIYRWKNYEYIKELIIEHELETFQKQFRCHVSLQCKDVGLWMGRHG